MSDLYLKALEFTDKALELIVDGLNRFSDRDGYHLVLTSDHGGKGYHHLEDVPEITNVPIIIWGRDIRENHRIESAVSLLDVAPTISKILDIPPHFAWEGKPVSEVFIADLKNNSISRVA
jgi:arylsulfatase A-like enzyme